ncbi:MULTISPECIES: hypothetical protein [Cyanophyceae]|uniref:FeoC-like transcriptional regulator n=1 Tax=Leptolyngbya subtilissima DQ-A4 TaxID=2933933 RepID=A0ABV0K3T8_9CYAN|nr:hypothetical protein [Nodosilinea sp. FACHB-141]MBD2113433.1 hypothetical protein [Nodosilinea sp. FACHB-141]
MTSPAEREAPNFQHRPVGSAGPKTMTDLLALAEPERTLLNWLLRQRGASLADIMAHTQAEPAAIQAMLDNLMATGFLILHNDAAPPVFKPNLISRKPRAMPEELWESVE